MNIVSTDGWDEVQGDEKASHHMWRGRNVTQGCPTITLDLVEIRRGGLGIVDRHGVWDGKEGTYLAVHIRTYRMCWSWPSSLASKHAYLAIPFEDISSWSSRVDIIIHETILVLMA
jgi:hypothetical protein